jgi:hypothetical protein
MYQQKKKLFANIIYKQKQTLLDNTNNSESCRRSKTPKIESHVLQISKYSINIVSDTF